jgi:hypothetical protein
MAEILELEDVLVMDAVYNRRRKARPNPTRSSAA